jgi:hypothetical protein
MRFNEEEYEETLDDMLRLVGVPDAVPEAGPCATMADLASWFWQFGRACRAARLRPLG